MSWKLFYKVWWKSIFISHFVCIFSELCWTLWRPASHLTWLFCIVAWDFLWRLTRPNLLKTAKNYPSYFGFSSKKLLPNRRKNVSSCWRTRWFWESIHLSARVWLDQDLPLPHLRINGYTVASSRQSCYSWSRNILYSLACSCILFCFIYRNVTRCPIVWSWSRNCSVSQHWWPNAVVVKNSKRKFVFKNCVSSLRRADRILIMTE